uniref:Uncharacterized protein n=1 Tax=Nelumbo nucifera TaxID=4432 RepID=A0A822XR63_NELNU|nr:TPA_asm: hypothetical protein HUJ06_021431 [Nelumbo nucifera]
MRERERKRVWKGEGSVVALPLHRLFSVLLTIVTIYVICVYLIQGFYIVYLVCARYLHPQSIHHLPLPTCWLEDSRARRGATLPTRGSESCDDFRLFVHRLPEFKCLVVRLNCFHLTIRERKSTKLFRDLRKEEEGFRWGLFQLRKWFLVSTTGLFSPIMALSVKSLDIINTEVISSSRSQQIFVAVVDDARKLS